MGIVMQPAHDIGMVNKSFIELIMKFESNL